MSQRATASWGDLACRLRDRLRARVASDGPEAPSDSRPAAVLVPVLPPDWLLFTVRSRELPHHAGQVSFPGGLRDAADRDLVATALREAEEEIGVHSSAVEVAGALDPVVTSTGFTIHPAVGFLSAIPESAETPWRNDEVERVFLVPLTVLGDPAIHRERAAPDGWPQDLLHEFQVPPGAGLSGDEPAVRIWGATARITHQLLNA